MKKKTFSPKGGVMNRKFTEKKPKWPIYLLNSTAILKTTVKLT